MAHLALTCFIAAPPEQVWDVLADLDGHAAWMADVRSLRVVSERTRGVGAVVEVQSELFGAPVVRDVMVVTRWEPPTRLSVAHRGAFHGTGDFLLDAADNGTIFTWVEDFAPPLGPLGEAAFSLLVRPHLERVFRRSLENLGRIVTERAAHPST